MVIGTPSANRGHTAIEPLIGFFVNTLALRVDLSGEPSAAQLLERVRRTTLDAQTHQDLPFEQVVEIVQPSRRLAHTPLFQVMFAWQNNETEAWQLPELEVTPADLAYDVVKFDLELNLYEADEEIVGTLSYATALFERATIERHVEYLQTMLQAMVADAQQPVARVELLTPAERTLLLQTWNATQQDYPAHQCIHQLFEAQAERTPEATALVYEDQTLSYAQLNARANRLAHRLIELGVQPDARVAICVERSPAMVVGLLAILKAGGAYVPLDPAYPSERLAHILADAAPDIVLADAVGQAALGEAALVKCTVLDPNALPNRAHTNPSVPGLTARHLAYVIYTSGSTGTPKGVMVEHCNVVNLAQAQIACFEVRADSRVLQFASFSFDASVSEIVMALVSGAALFLPPDMVRRDQHALCNYLTCHAITHATLPPALLQNGEGLFSFNLPLTLILAGEAPSATLTRTLNEQHTVFNAYGPTEASVCATAWRSSRDFNGEVIPIGRPIANTQVYLLDAYGQPVPLGAVGELYIGGAGVARGYLNRPELTAERFVPDPFRNCEDARMYKTGDLARYRPDGNLEFVGRNDHQVKLRGFRIEPGEIEACLAGHPQVHDAAVLALGDGGDKRLVAYVVAEPDDALASTLRAHVAAVLPEYMVPAAFMRLDTFPLTLNGKLDRRALPAPEFISDHCYRAPRTPQERTLAKLFTDVLGVPRVGVDDSFFDLGGDSILSIQLVSRARKAGWAITPREVFQHQSVAALAIVAKPLDDTQPAVADIATGEVPLTPIIRWFLEYDGPIGRFNQTMLLQVPAALQADHLITALQALLDHHDALRLQLLPSSAQGAGWTLQIPPAGAVSASACLRRVEIAELDEDVRQARISQEAQAAEIRLDPQAGVMLQAVWFEAGDAPGRLLLTIHHLVVDGVSWRILLPDLASAWQAAQAGQPIALEPTGTSLRRWAQWLSHEALSETRHAELPFWKRMLSGTDALLSARPLDPAHDTIATAQRLSLTLPATLTSPLLGAVPARFHGRVNDVLLSAFALAVACWRQRQGHYHPDVLIDLEGHGRESRDVSLDLSRTVGWFTSLFPVRFELDELELEAALEGGPTLGRLVKRVKEQLRALPDHGLGYGLLRYLNAETALHLKHLPMPQISFNYLSRFAAPEAQDWEPAPESTLVGGSDPAMPLFHAISLNAFTLDRPDGPELMANWSWAGALFTVEQMQDLAQTWFQILETLVAYAEQPYAGGLTPSDVPLVSLSQDQIEQLEATQAGLEDILPLSPLQKGQLFHALQADQGSNAYAMPMIFDLEGTLDSQALQAAIQALLQRHASLRASFVHQGLNEPVQVIPRTVPLPWQESNLSGLDDAAREAAYQRFLQEVCSRRFNPSQPPLLRFGLVRLTSNQSRLVLVCHHILLDGWSMPVLIQELFALYANGGDGHALPRVTPYRDYLAWLKARDHATAERAWREVLAGLQEPTRLAPARLTTSTLQESLTWTLSETLTHTLNQQARQQRLTLNTLVQGAWGLLLTHLTGRDDVVFGVTVAGRPPELPGIEHMVGLLIHTPPLRFQCSPMQPIADVLARLQDQQICLLEHQHLDLADIERVTGLGQLFDTLVVFENYPVDHRAGQAVDKLRIVGISGSTATHYPLSLTAVPGAQLSFQLGYRPDLFDRETVERLIQRLIRLFEAIAQDPDQLVGRIEWLDATERQQLLVDWNTTARRIPETTLSTLFEAQVTQTPDAIALVFKDRLLSYTELNAQANRLAHCLIRQGIEPETPVAILMPRTPERIVATLAVIKAGGTYIPLNDTDPDSRLQAVLCETRARLLLTDRTLQARGKIHDARIIVVDADPSAAREPSHNPAPACAPEQLACLTYASDCTGQPKGIGITHRNVLNLALNGPLAGTRECVLLHSPPTFGASMYELWTPLLTGGQVVIAPPDALDVPALQDVIQRYQVSALWLTTGLFHRMTEGDPSCLGTVRHVLVEGEALCADAVQQVLDSCPEMSLIHDYGPTEITAFAICHAMRTANSEQATVPIGTPLGNVQAYVLDAGLRPVPVGVPGELYLSGDGVGRGYVHRPGWTAERFVPHPFGPEGARLYRTGDLVRWRPDRTLDFISRTDRQVTIDGWRIEPGEVEAALRRHPAVAQAAVIARKDSAGHKQLIGYAVPHQPSAEGGARIEPADLRQYVATQLPAPMVPAAVIWLDSLPLMSNGKLDRKALPAWDAWESMSSQTPMEKALAELWAEIFGLKKVHRHDNFFDLGGHSLLAMRLISRIHARLNVSITIRTLFEAPSVAELAQRLIMLDGVQENAFAVLLPLQPKGTRPPLFCIHPGGGLSWSYIGLSRHLGADQPVYGLQDRGFDGAVPLAETIDAMASDYIEHIRRIQPNGPYHLLGWSFGGYVAHSMATQLEQQGESVALLALLDSDLNPDRLSDERELDQDAIYALVASHYGDEMIFAIDERLWENACKVMQNHRRIRRIFSPSIYSGDALFFRATIAEDGFHTLASSNEWKPYVLGNIAVYDIHCKHADMVQPEPTAEIGRILARKLEELTKIQPSPKAGEILE
ncbi:amino acid adenylation domain-containing protein [Mycetohabitans sp. B8]|uniref:amino acid adenylation domain-containing protein n=1 Tax=Mycetohabitans sp. B8 TaxID=2841845 RepID=UPI00210567F7|nr:non-ribosomal peptide synthetase [Mycetohabitans sp. B8]